jgi:hypothetical protein
MWLWMVRSKDQVVGVIKQYQQIAKPEIGRKLKAFRIVRRGEFTSVEVLEDYCNTLFLQQ